jgi:hypothetical protein
MRSGSQNHLSCASSLISAVVPSAAPNGGAARKVGNLLRLRNVIGHRIHTQARQTEGRLIQPSPKKTSAGSTAATECSFLRSLRGDNGTTFRRGADVTPTGRD